MEKLKTTSIKGKDYVEVSTRVDYFRRKYPNYKLMTDLIEKNIYNEKNNHIALFKATVLNEKNEIVSTGHAYEIEGKGLVNTTSYIENAETSAIGRALGFLGIGIENGIASAEEIQTAIENEDKKLTLKNNKPGTITKDQLKKIKNMYYAETITAKDLNGLLKKYNVKKVEELKSEDADNIIEFIKGANND